MTDLTASSGQASPRVGPAQGPAQNAGTNAGLYALIIGVAVLAVLSITAILVFRSNGTTVAAVISAASAPVATLVGTYFGIRTGADTASAALQRAVGSRDAAEQTALVFAALMDPAKAREALAALGVPMPDAEANSE